MKTMKKTTKTAKIKTINKHISLVLAVIMLLAVFAPLVSSFADSADIFIKNEKDYLNLVKKCKTDTWSKGKTVTLANDIDLSKTDFSPIPTFGGHFDGKGYTISGIKINKKGSATGLFRYIQSGATVENLNVSGTVTPDGTQKNIGGIVGSLSGTLKNCTFSGNIKAKTNVGGIAGYVTETGVIDSCTFSGSVIATSYTGGIAGQNFGTISNCENKGSINTKNTEESKTIQDVDIDITNLRSTENFEAATDTGGIAGYSKGKISDCTNRGNVGYKSVGYNTGGICGRQAGYLNNCTNYGTINGRKDIGGIVGQAEPYIILEYTRDVLEQANDVFGRIQDIADDNSLLSGTALGDSFDSLNDTLSRINSSAGVLSDDMSTYADKISDSANEISDRLNTAVEDAKGALDDAGKGCDALSLGMKSMEKSAEQLKNIVDDLRDAYHLANKSDGHLDDAMYYLERMSIRTSMAIEDLSDALKKLERGSKKLQTASKSLRLAFQQRDQAIKNLKDMWDAIGDIQTGISDGSASITEIAKILKDLVDKGYIKADITELNKNLLALAKAYKNIAIALGDVRDGVLMMAEDFDMYTVASAFKTFAEAFDNLTEAIHYFRLARDDFDDAIDKLDDVSDSAKIAADTLKEGLSHIADSTDYLSSSVKKLADIADDFTKKGAVKMPVASEIFGNDFDNLLDEMKNMQNDFTNIKNVLSGKKDILSDKIDALNDEIRQLRSVLTKSYDDNIKADDDGFVEDVSDIDILSTTQGRIEGSRNRGEVYGDISVGGVVGSMAVEYDFDPEDDVKDRGTKSLKFTYKTKCVLRRCVNEGKVNSAKNYAGGIVGRMDLGTVLSCEGYGAVKADDGDYVGGIAGASETVIRNSAAKCTVSGNDYVGGVAGKADTVSHCYTVVTAEEHGEYAGAIAGDADDKSKISGNVFVGGELGGLDDINYTGKAQEGEISDYVSFVKSSFNTDTEFNLKFTADGKLIATVPFKYREEITADKIPSVPEKKGYYGKWSSYDFTSPEYETEIEAEYYRDIDIVESSLTRDGKAIMLLCGAFDDSASIRIAKNSQNHTKMKKVLDSYTVKIDGDYNDKHTVRYLPSENIKKVKLYAEYDGKIKKLKAKKFGSYLEFEISSGDFTIYETQKNYILGIVLKSLLAVIIALIIAFIIKNRRKFKMIFKRIKLPKLPKLPKADIKKLLKG